MGKVHDKAEGARQAYRASLDRVLGSAPWLKAKDVKHFKAKVFKSGNSLALRLPAGLGLAAGTEMDLRVENGEHYSFEPSESPKRKFNVAKVWGAATGLELIKPEDRIFEERKLTWDQDEPEESGTKGE